MNASGPVRALRALAVGILAGAAVVVAPPASQAQRAVQLVTPYPAVVAGAGKTVTLNIQVITPTRRRVDLQVVQVPPGWQATLKGGGFVIYAVFGGPDKPPDQKAPEIQLEVKVPGDAAPGDYPVVVRGTSGGASDTLTLNLKVVEKAPGAVSLTADFPTLRGKSDQTFTFKVTLANNTPEKTSFALSAEGPPGWRVEARPQQETRAATVTVDGGGTATVELEADPPDNVPAGQYPVKLLATGGGQRAEGTFTVEITGNVKFELSTVTDRLNVSGRAGGTTVVPLVIRNTGTAILREVTLSNSAPSGWQVRFTPDKVRDVRPNQSKRVDARITPSGDALAGDYSVTLTATSEGTSSSKEIRFAVKTSRFWGFVGLLLIAGAAWFLYRTFQKYGRR